MTSFKDLREGYKDLIVGGIYEIYVPEPPYTTIEQRHITKVFKDYNIRYVKILEHTPVVRNPAEGIFDSEPYSYKVATYNDKMIEIPIKRIDNTGRLQEPKEFIIPRTKIRIVRKVGLAPSEKIAIGDAELQKQRSAQAKQIVESIGLPSRKDAGPLSDILSYAGIKAEVRPRIKGGKTKKSKRRTHKRK